MELKSHDNGTIKSTTLHKLTKSSNVENARQEALNINENHIICNLENASLEQ